jgi:hypothetical protein
VLYLRRPLHDRQATAVLWEGRFRYSDLKEAAPRGSLWVFEQVLMICEVAIAGCAQQMEGEIVEI